MRRNALSTSLWLVAIATTFASGTVQAADLIWQVEIRSGSSNPPIHSPPRRPRSTRVRGAPTGPLPADIIWRVERRLNDPDCKDASTPDRCAETAGPRYAQSRLGWAAQTLGDTCYESDGRPRRYRRSASANIPGARPRKTTFLPDAHTVANPDRARSAHGRGRRLPLELAAAQAGRQAGNQEARLQGQAHDLRAFPMRSTAPVRACRSR